MSCQWKTSFIGIPWYTACFEWWFILYASNGVELSHRKMAMGDLVGNGAERRLVVLACFFTSRELLKNYFNHGTISA